jgi:hypothetical protein
MRKMVKVSNLHKKIKLRDILDLFSTLGSIDGYSVDGDAVLLHYGHEHRASLLNNFPVAGKRMRVEEVEWDGALDRAEGGSIVAFTGDYDADDLRDECSIFGLVVEVRKEGRTVHVHCKSEADASGIYYGMYGRFYDGRRIRCSLNK